MTIESASIQELPKTYSAASVESRLYQFWEEHGYFRPGPLHEGEGHFAITIPPPNVTGELHLGHALTYTIEDVLGRFKRMLGYETLILPGTDHASIAVHTKVEALLAERGETRRDIGRERFVEEAWAWKERYGRAIDLQFRALGEGYDWSRERFTMDPEYHRAVNTMFVRLYDEGYIYRGSRVINWCPDCRTGISDIEVRQDLREDSLFYVRLPFSDGSGDIVVATVRPETMLGDVAVAVHPDDERYQSAAGKTITHPITGAELPVVQDAFVDPRFGTGAVKITPAHDYADFEVAERHHLPMPVVITPEATMAKDTGQPYAGLSVERAREVAVDYLRREGYLIKEEPYVHNVPLCDRSGTVIEPLLSEQWFMRMEDLARPAIDAVREGKVRFVPERWTKVYLDWMENIRPWNISRQLWWGQRIPIFTCANGHVQASVDRPEVCGKCDSTLLHQDPDVLDTWFSSAIWPFATLGWPDRTEDLQRFYPTSFMNTSSQILYLWIARMIMMGIHFMGDIPFPVVLINPTILNEKGQRMSKSLGTGIDPLETVERYGADATRFGVLSAGSIMQQEIRISGYEKAEEGRNFTNKIWNAARFVLQNVGESKGLDLNGESFPLADRWILSRLNTVTNDVTQSLESYDLTRAVHTIYDFFWSEFADWYIEISKSRLGGTEGGTVRAVLWSILDRTMRLLHPFMPFVTEEVWQQLKNIESPQGLQLSMLSGPLPDSIMIAPWPQTGTSDRDAEASMAVLMNVVRAIRNLRAEHGVKPRDRIQIAVESDSHQQLLAQEGELIEALAGVKVMEDSSVGASGDVAELVVEATTIRVPLAQLTNIEEEIRRITKEISRLKSEAERARVLLENTGFTSKAPENIVDAERTKLKTAETSLEQLEASLARLSRR